MNGKRLKVKKNNGENNLRHKHKVRNNPHYIHKKHAVKKSQESRACQD